MKQKCLFFITLIISIFLSSCDSFKKNYKIAIENGTVHIIMRSPMIGISGLNSIDFDGFTPREIEERVFNKIRKRDYNGDYNVYVTLQYKDEYGNYNEAPNSIHVCTINGGEVKKYVDFKYFDGLQLEKAYITPRYRMDFTK